MAVKSFMPITEAAKGAEHADVMRKKIDGRFFRYPIPNREEVSKPKMNPLTVLFSFLALIFVSHLAEGSHRLDNVKTMCNPLKERIKRCMESLPPYEGAEYEDKLVGNCLRTIENWDECTNWFLYKTKF